MDSVSNQIAQSRAIVPPCPDTLIRRLVVDRTVSVLDFTVYTFQRSKSTANKRGHRDGAMITVPRHGTTFKLSYYPLSGENQIVEELPVSELAKAVDDLVSAGFPHRVVTSPANPPAQTPPPLRIADSS